MCMHNADTCTYQSLRHTGKNRPEALGVPGSHASWPEPPGYVGVYNMLLPGGHHVLTNEHACCKPHVKMLRMQHQIQMQRGPTAATVAQYKNAPTGCDATYYVVPVHACCILYVLNQDQNAQWAAPTPARYFVGACHGSGWQYCKQHWAQSTAGSASQQRPGLTTSMTPHAAGAARLYTAPTHQHKSLFCLVCSSLRHTLPVRQVYHAQGMMFATQTS
jgi:hypothetical protein